MENLLADELRLLGAENIKASIAGVAFKGNMEAAYRVCLWSRLANRVLLVLSAFPVQNQQELYDGVFNINWHEHMAMDASIAVTFSARNSKAISNTHFGALKVKDAIVDQMRNKFNQRPTVKTFQPDLRINVYLQAEQAQLSLDLSGESLHRRGYRNINIEAPLKENLAAAMLYRCSWPEIAHRGGTLLDPMCGSGTLVLEAALMAADFAPGLLRSHFGFLHWKKHRPDCWQKLLDDALQRKQQGLEKMPSIVGFDHNRQAVNAAINHIENAGLKHKIHIERREISSARPAESWQPGLLICNPPYGERLGSETETAELYRCFGEILKANFQGWQAGLIISDQELGFRLGIRSQKPITLYNGALECKLLRMKIESNAFFTPKARNQQERLQQINLLRTNPMAGSNLKAEMFANRLKKNFRKLKKWAERKQITCYRLYDADLPEYALAVDLYQGSETWVNVQEYEAPKSIDPRKADLRLNAALAEIPGVLNIPAAQVFLKIRRKQKSSAQYEKQATGSSFHRVEENGCRFWVNFENYLDTGLFLDHRPLRFMIQQQANGKRFLNLFCYTGTATVNAAIGGALSTTSVDISNTYLEWAGKNLALNGCAGEHNLIRADCLEWLTKSAQQKDPPQYDLIFLDPPTFSNSKRMEQVFDIQLDHVQLINTAVKLLAPNGVLFFSTNFRRFKLDKQAFADLIVEDISFETIAEDFSRNQRIHYCWKIRE